MDWSTILSRKWPGQGWTLRDTTDFASLVWSAGNALPKPTQQEVEAFWPEVQAVLLSEAQASRLEDKLRRDPGALFDVVETISLMVHFLRQNLRATALTQNPPASLLARWDALVARVVQIRNED